MFARKAQTLELSVLNGISSATVQKNRENDCESQMEWVTPGKQCLPDKTEQVRVRIYRACGSMLQACAGLRQMGSQHWEEQADKAPIPKPETISNWQPLAEENLVFFSGVSLGW